MLRGHGSRREFQSTLPGWGATRRPDRETRATVFQSTLPGWGATGLSGNPPVQGRISIHAPRMGSDLVDAVGAPLDAISIHAPRMGSDQHQATIGRHRALISIHAPRMGSDWPERTWASTPTNFNPRSPDGERRAATTLFDGLVQFQSTLPGWGATGDQRCHGREGRISIHAPRMGSDETVLGKQSEWVIFQSTLPGWGATSGG